MSLSNKHLILAEKNSAAKNFAKALGGVEGVFAGIPYKIVAARGHLLQLKEPYEMVDASKQERYKSWQLETLPWQAEDIHWSKVPAKVKDRSTGKMTTMQSMIQAIQQASKDCETIVIATDVDPSGEGELLAWEVIDAIGWSGAVKRMYFTDESVHQVQKAFQSMATLSTDKNQDGDYVKAEGRQRFDFLSIQLTRAATTVARQNKVLERGIPLRQGRVKSVMIKLVYDQLEKIKQYKKVPFYEVRFKDEHGNVFKRKVDKDDPNAFCFLDRQDAENEKQTYHTATVVKDKETKKHTAPPALLDLSALSSILSKKGYAIKEVLATYQKMYEDHIVSYPRTEDKYISVEQFKEMLPLIDKIAGVVGADKGLLTHRQPRKTHVKDGGAHGANRPGVNVPKSLNDLKGYGPSAVEIYTILGRNFLAMFGEDYEYISTQAYLKEYPTFRAIVNTPIGNPCFKDIFNLEQYTDKDGNAEKENNATLGTKANPFIHEGANPKPAYPTAQWLTKQLEKADVGTGATRSSTLSEITEGKLAMMSIQKGRLSMKPIGNMSAYLLKDSMIGDVKVTADLQTLMSALGDFKADMREIYAKITEIVQHDKEVFLRNGQTMANALQLKVVSEASFEPKEKVSGMFKGEAKTISRSYGSHRFTDEEVAQLFDGQDVEIVLKSKEGRDFQVKGRLTDFTYKGKVYFGFQPYPKEASTMANAKIPEEYCKHYFTTEEIQALRQGQRVHITDGVSKQGKPLDIEVYLGEKEYKGRKYIGLKVDFVDSGEVPDAWQGHTFTLSEKEKLKNGEKVTIEAISKEGRPYTVDVTFEESEWNGHTKKRIVPHFESFKQDVPDKWGIYEFTEEEKEKLRNGETIHVVSFSKKTNAPFDADIRYGEYEYQGKKRKGIILLKNKGKK